MYLNPTNDIYYRKDLNISEITSFELKHTRRIACATLPIVAEIEQSLGSFLPLVFESPASLSPLAVSLWIHKHTYTLT